MATTRTRRIAGACACLLAVASYAAEPAKPSSPGAPPAPPPSAASDSDMDALYQAGQQLFDQYAPPEVKAQYAFPSKQEWDAFTVRLQHALESDSLDDLADYAPQARALLSTLRTLGVDDDLADWLEQRLDETEAAAQIRALAPSVAPEPPSVSQRPAPPAAPPREIQPAPPPPRPAAQPPVVPPAPAVAIPHYDLWLARVRNRPVPSRAAELMPTLRRAFTAEGVPPSLAWIAEAESSFNPTARSPSGARGLFQLTPDTAHRLGLDTFLPDQRTDPEKSAHAAARYLRELHDEFGSWPLALAAYNAGSGRVSRALAARHAKDFGAIANALPAETRMYVPKVCALVETRTGKSIAAL